MTVDTRGRSLMHRAAICELVIPYGDPAEKYSRKNPFDMGEPGMGTIANSLTPGRDCLGSIHYFDAHLTNTWGEPMTIKDAICLHEEEEDAGILGKHTDGRLKQTQVRRSRRLLVLYFATAGNYDYGFY